MKSYFESYAAAHRHPANRFCHSLGIPLIIISLAWLGLTHGSHTAWILFSIGWLFQLVGHAIERTWPEFLKSPIYFIIGPIYFIRKFFFKSP